MMRVFLAFFAFGLFMAWREWLDRRAYNRRMFTSMQKGPVYVWPVLIFSMLGAVAAFAIRFIQNP